MLKTELAIRGIKQNQAAKTAEVSPTEVHYWCSLKRPIPVVRALKLHTAYGIPMESMIPEYEEKVLGIAPAEPETLADESTDGQKTEE